MRHAAHDLLGHQPPEQGTECDAAVGRDHPPVREPRNASDDRVMVCRHRAHAETAVDDRHLARRRQHTGGTHEQDRRELRERGRIRFPGELIDLLGTQQQASAGVGPDMNAWRVHDSLERLNGARRHREEPGETAHRHVDTKGFQECLRRRSHAH